MLVGVMMQISIDLEELSETWMSKRNQGATLSYNNKN